MLLAMRNNGNEYSGNPAKPPINPYTYQNQNTFIPLLQPVQILPNNQPRETEDIISAIQSNLPPKYKFIHELGKGSFGHVVKCFNFESNNYVAIKFLNKSRGVSSILNEVDTLGLIKSNDHDDLFIHILDQIQMQNFHGIVLELLGENLYEHLKRNNFIGLSMQQTIYIAYQLGLAFKALSEFSIIHCDLKPENIAIVLNSPPDLLKIKVIDFGSSCTNGYPIYRYIQSRFYRAPEVILEIPYNNLIDVWSIGCVLVELTTGRALFPGATEFEQICYFYKYLGPPSINFIQQSKKAGEFYSINGKILILKHNRADSKFNLRTFVGDIIMESSSVKTFLFSEGNGNVAYRRQVMSMFVNLITHTLIYDPQNRITPHLIVNHPLFQRFSNIFKPSYQQTPNQLLNYGPGPPQIIQPTPQPQAYAVCVSLSNPYTTPYPQKTMVQRTNDIYFQIQQPTAIVNNMYNQNMQYNPQPQTNEFNNFHNSSIITYPQQNYNIQAKNTCCCNKCAAYGNQFVGYIVPPEIGRCNQALL